MSSNLTHDSAATAVHDILLTVRVVSHSERKEFVFRGCTPDTTIDDIKTMLCGGMMRHHDENRGGGEDTAGLVDDFKSVDSRSEVGDAGLLERLEEEEPSAIPRSQMVFRKDGTEIHSTRSNAEPGSPLRATRGSKLYSFENSIGANQSPTKLLHLLYPKQLETVIQLQHERHSGRRDGSGFFGKHDNDVAEEVVLHLYRASMKPRIEGGTQRGLPGGSMKSPKVINARGGSVGSVSPIRRDPTDHSVLANGEIRTRSVSPLTSEDERSNGRYSKSRSPAAADGINSSSNSAGGMVEVVEEPLTSSVEREAVAATNAPPASRGREASAPIPTAKHMEEKPTSVRNSAKTDEYLSCDSDASDGARSAGWRSKSNPSAHATTPVVVKQITSFPGEAYVSPPPSYWNLGNSLLDKDDGFYDRISSAISKTVERRSQSPRSAARAVKDDVEVLSFHEISPPPAAVPVEERSDTSSQQLARRPLVFPTALHAMDPDERWEESDSLSLVSETTMSSRAAANEPIPISHGWRVFANVPNSEDDSPPRPRPVATPTRQMTSASTVAAARLKLDSPPAQAASSRPSYRDPRPPMQARPATWAPYDAPRSPERKRIFLNDSKFDPQRYGLATTKGSPTSPAQSHTRTTVSSSGGSTTPARARVDLAKAIVSPMPSPRRF